MPQDLIIWVVVAWFLLFLVFGQSVATVLFASGMVGIALWVGPQVFSGIIASNIFFTASTYSLSIIPLYLLMAQLLLRGGVVVDLFQVGYRLSGHRRFPLGLATIVSGGMLGAVSGSGPPRRRRWPPWPLPSSNSSATPGACRLRWLRWPDRCRPSFRRVSS